MRIDRRVVPAVALAAALTAGAFGQAPANPSANPSNQENSSPSGVVTAPKGNPYRVAAGLPARIVTFTSQPASIQPGQPVTLIWLTENPSGVTLEPGVGRVTSRGSRQLFPKATTTYTLAVRGPNNTTLTQSVTVNVAGTAPVAATTEPVETVKRIPQTPDGKPDLSGVYGLAFNLAPAPAAPGASAAGGAVRAGAPAIPTPELKPGAEKFRIVRGPEDAGPTANCMPLIGPQAFGVPYQFQIVQNARSIVLMHEYPGVFRIITLDGNPHPVDPDPSWMGDSVGHWEGDTLVVDVIGFNEKTELSGYRHTEALHLVERFRRIDYDTLRYEVTMEDPNVFAKPWVVARNFSLRPELRRIDEFVCENNRDYGKFFKKE